MKKALLFAITVVGVFALIVSCKKEDLSTINPTDNSGAIESFVLVSSSDTSATRMTYTVKGENVEKAWTPGTDKLIGFVKNGDNFHYFTFVCINAEGSSSTWQRVKDESEAGYPPLPADPYDIFMMYAPGADASDLSDGTLSIDFSSQTDGQQPVLMSGKGIASKTGGQIVISDMNFVNHVAVMNINNSTLDSVSSSVDVLGFGLDNVITDGTLSYSDGGIVFTSGTTVGNIILNPSGDGQWNSSSSTFIAFPAGTYDESMKARIQTEDADYCYKILSESKAFAVKAYRLSGKEYERQPVAKVGEEYYKTVESAVSAANAATSEVTITMLHNTSAGAIQILNSSQKVTLNLAGKKLSLSGTLTTKSEVEIIDTTSSNAGSIYAPSAIAVTADGGSLTVSGGTLESSAAEAYTLKITNGAQAVIRGDAHIISNNYRSVYLYGSETAAVEATLAVSGGWLQCANGQSCIVTTRTTKTSDHRRCYLTITGGHFSCAGEDYDTARRCIYRGYDNCTTIVSGGFFDTGSIYRFYNGKQHDYTAPGYCISSTQTVYPDEYAAGYTHCVKIDNSPEAIDKAVRNLFDQTGAKNLVVMAYKGGKVVYSSTFGYRCCDAGVEKDTLEINDIYRIASVSKNFTAAAMMLLVDRGLVNLDTPVNDYLSLIGGGKSASVVNPTYPEVPITVRMLLNHTSTIGGSNYAATEIFSKITYSANKPGEVYSYSNMGTVVAGAVVEAVTGERLDNFVRENLLKKVDMPYSDYDSNKIDTTQGPKFVRLYSSTGTIYYTKSAYKPLFQDFTESDYVPGYNTGLINPAGNIKTNASSLGRWMRTLQLGGLSPDGVRVIPAALVDSMHNSAVKISDTKEYGFFLTRTKSLAPGVWVCGHNGSADGANTSMYYGMRTSPEGKVIPVVPGCAEDWGVVTLASGNNNETTLPVDLTKLLYDLLLSQNAAQ